MLDEAGLSNFRVAQYRLTLRVREPLHLPQFMANTLRGGFGAVFKHLVCVYDPPRPCEPCLLRHTCAYSTLFETAPPPDSAVLRRNSAVARPFVLEPPLDGKTHYDRGQTLDVGLVLVGRGLAYLPYFLVVFEELGRVGLGASRSRFGIAVVRRVNGLTGEEVPLAFRHVLALAGSDGGVDFAQVAAAARNLPVQDEVSLRFLTPTRLVHDNDPVAVPDFQALVRALLRRISSLAYFHCGERWTLDFRHVIEEAARVRLTRSELRWCDWQRYSARQRMTMKLGGFVGNVTYRGSVRPFLPLLLLGTMVHVGKACTFGHGKYELVGLSSLGHRS